jgi:hypothetical protein
MNDDSGFWGQALEQAQKVLAHQCHASGGGPEAIACHMKKNRAAAAGDSRPRVVIDFDNQVVKAICPQQPVAWFTGRPPERPVVAAILRVFTPGVTGTDASDRQQSARPRQAVGAPPQANWMESPSRRRAIAFALRRLNAGSAEGGTDRAIRGDQPGLCSQLRTGTDMDCGKRGRALALFIAPHRPHLFTPTAIVSDRTNDPSNILSAHDLSANRFPVSPIML